jgi:hypothetical protein
VTTKKKIVKAIKFNEESTAISPELRKRATNLVTDIRCKSFSVRNGYFLERLSSLFCSSLK